MQSVFFTCQLGKVLISVSSNKPALKCATGGGNHEKADDDYDGLLRRRSGVRGWQHSHECKHRGLQTGHPEPRFQHDRVELATGRLYRRC